MISRTVAIIVALTFLLNTTALAATFPPPAPSELKVKANCLPVCAVPVIVGLKEIGDVLVALSLITIVATSSENEAISKLDKLKKRRQPTYIYRSGALNSYQMTPRDEIDPLTKAPKDWNGLSYYTSAPMTKPYNMTTVEAVNETGYLQAVRDGYNHVSVRPKTSLEMAEWLASKKLSRERPHRFSLVLMSISVEVR